MKQAMWQRICFCDPVAMATTVQRQIILVLNPINSKTAVIYAGPLAKEWKAAFQFCITVLVAAKFCREETVTAHSIVRNRRKTFHWQEPFVFHSNVDLSSLTRWVPDLLF